MNNSHFLKCIFNEQNFKQDDFEMVLGQYEAFYLINFEYFINFDLV
jgi:hypothetical protein